MRNQHHRFRVILVMLAHQFFLAVNLLFMLVGANGGVITTLGRIFRVIRPSIPTTLDDEELSTYYLRFVDSPTSTSEVSSVANYQHRTVGFLVGSALGFHICRAFTTKGIFREKRFHVEYAEAWRKKIGTVHHEIDRLLAVATSKIYPVAISDVRTPCYVVNMEVAANNAAKMLKTAESLGVNLRPHCKTHKTVEVALLQTGGVRRRITVSTLAEASFYAENEFDDILYAVPLTPDKVGSAADLSSRLDTFIVCVDSASQLDAILAHVPATNSFRWKIAILVDCGYHREGVRPESAELIELGKAVSASPFADFFGVYTHGGHSYEASCCEEVRAVAMEEGEAVTLAKSRLAQAGVHCGMVGVGSTPTCCNPPRGGFGEAVNEMHPGNYVFLDTTQLALGSCGTLDDIAVRVLTRVVGHYPKSNSMQVLCLTSTTCCDFYVSKYC